MSPTGCCAPRRRRSPGWWMSAAVARVCCRRWRTSAPFRPRSRSPLPGRRSRTGRRRRILRIRCRASRTRCGRPPTPASGEVMATSSLRLSPPVPPVGNRESATRTETDSMGAIEVPAEHYWGAQTQRSLIHFSIGDDHMPKAVYHAYGYVKKAAAIVNAAAGRLPRWKADAIARAADEAIAGKLDDHFPLYVWQTGSGTQSNMNVNEVLSNRAIQLLGGEIGSKSPVHPNDDVNMGQSSNDSFPTAMHIAAVMELEEHLLPHADALTTAIEAKSNEWMDVVKTGRTHLMDATPLTVGQEWSGWAHQIRDGLARMRGSEA